MANNYVKKRMSQQLADELLSPTGLEHESRAAVEMCWFAVASVETLECKQELDWFSAG